MADEGYNTHAELRAIAGMGTSIPTDAIITHWVNLVDGLIERYNAVPDDDIARLIEANRISILYWNLKHDTGRTEYNAAVAPLSMEEKEMLSDFDADDTNVDSISMNGSRSSEIFGSRR